MAGVLTAPAGEERAPAPAGRRAFALPAPGAWLPPLLIALIAALPRLVGLQYMEFKADEAAVALHVRQMLEGGSFLQVGIGSSVGVRNAPLFAYLMTIPLAITSDPRLAVAAIALANVGGVLVTYALARRLWGTFAADITGMLFAVAPWAVEYSRKLWEQDLEPCLAACCLYALVRAGEGKAWWAAGAVAIYLWMCQVHPSAILLAPAFLLAGSAFWCAVRRPPMLAGLGVGLLPLVPYLAANAAQHWPDLQALTRALGRPATVDLMALQAALSAVAGLGTPQIESVPFTRFLAAPAAFQALSLLATAALLAAIVTAAVVCVGQSRRGASAAARQQAGTLRLLLGWALIPVALATRHSVPIYPHYELVVLPAAFLLLGFAAALAAGRLPGLALVDDRARSAAPFKRGRSAGRVAAVSAIPAILVVGWAIILAGFLRSLPPRPFVWDYGVPYADSVRVAALGRTAADGDPLWLRTDAVIQPMLHYFLRDLPDQQPLPANTVVLPPPGKSAGYLIDDVNDGAALSALRAAGARNVGQMTYMDDLHHVVAMRWDGGALPSFGSFLRPLPIRLANGVQFLGYAVARPTPTTVRAALAWRVGRVGAGVSDSDLALYVHLLNSAGKTVAQQDDMPYPSARWQAGQTIFVAYDLPLRGLPPGRYDLRAGMYRRPSIERISALDAYGQPRDGEFALGSVTLAP